MRKVPTYRHSYSLVHYILISSHSEFFFLSSSSFVSTPSVYPFISFQVSFSSCTWSSDIYTSFLTHSLDTYIYLCPFKLCFSFPHPSLPPLINVSLTLNRIFNIQSNSFAHLVLCESNPLFANEPFSCR